MGRLFSVLALTLALLSAGAALTDAAAPISVQAVFFRMVFPQLMPDAAQAATPGEASPQEDAAYGEAVAL